MAYDKDRPATSEPIKTGWPVLLTNQAAIEATIDQDHVFTTGGSQTGKHNKVSLVEAADIGSGAEGLPILGAQTVGGKAELVFTDENDNDVQLTENGKTKSSSSDMKDEDDMSSNSATHTATQQSIKAYSDAATQTLTNKTLTAPVITSGVLNTAISGSAVLDEDDMSSNSNAKIATQQSIKAYIDSQRFGSLTGVDSESNNLVIAHAYLAQQDGIVHVRVEGVGLSTELKGYNGNTTDPAGAGTLLASVKNGSNFGDDGAYSITFAVASGRYFEVTCTSGTPRIFWQPMTKIGGAPIDQD